MRGLPTSDSGAFSATYCCLQEVCLLLARMEKAIKWMTRLLHPRRILSRIWLDRKLSFAGQLVMTQLMGLGPGRKT